MNKGRIMLALLAALGIAALSTLFIGHKLQKKSAPTVPEVKYVVAAKPIAAGEVLKAASLKEVAWPKNIPIQGGFRNVSHLKGRTTIYPVAAGAPVLNADLAAPGSGLGIGAHIPSGMRAVALRTNDVVAVGGFIYPGSHVDVLVTYQPQNQPTSITAIVLQDAKVLATGQKTEPNPNGKPMHVDIVTLLLTPEQAEKAVLASAKGEIHFVLRNGMDKKDVSVPPVDLAELVSSFVPHTAPRHLRHRRLLRRAKPKPKRYAVETILGNRTTKTYF